MYMSSYERQDYSFALKDHSKDSFFIACEPMNTNLSILQNGVLCLEINKGISFEDAQKISEYIQKNISAITYIKP